MTKMLSRLAVAVVLLTGLLVAPATAANASVYSSCTTHYTDFYRL
ncbi:hypothetical protein [Dactylosporangium sp. NPDC049140]